MFFVLYIQKLLIVLYFWFVNNTYCFCVHKHLFSSLLYFPIFFFKQVFLATHVQNIMFYVLKIFFI